MKTIPIQEALNILKKHKTAIVTFEYGVGDIGDPRTLDVVTYGLNGKGDHEFAIVKDQEESEEDNEGAFTEGSNQTVKIQNNQMELIDNIGRPAKLTFLEKVKFPAPKDISLQGAFDLLKVSEAANMVDPYGYSCNVLVKTPPSLNGGEFAHVKYSEEHDPCYSFNEQDNQTIKVSKNKMVLIDSKGEKIQLSLLQKFVNY